MLNAQPAAANDRWRTVRDLSRICVESLEKGKSLAVNHVHNALDGSNVVETFHTVNRLPQGVADPVSGSETYLHNERAPFYWSSLTSIQPTYLSRICYTQV
jgi:hypothetical protein